MKWFLSITLFLSLAACMPVPNDRSMKAVPVTASSLQGTQKPSVTISTQIASPTWIVTPTSMVTAQPVPTKTALKPTLTIAMSDLSKSMATPTSTQVFSSYASLPPGQYIAYPDEQKAYRNIYVISLDGNDQRLLTDKFKLFSSFTLLPNGKQLLVYEGVINGDTPNPKNFVLDLDWNTRTDLVDPENRCGYEYSPDLTMVVMSCIDREISVEFLDSHERVLLTNHSRPSEAYTAPSWSPDGKWIAYFNFPDLEIRPGTHDSEDGLYVVNTSCLSEPESCAKKARGPFRSQKWMYMQGPLAWSPDSRYIAMASEYRQSPIQIFDVKSDNFRYLDTLGVDFIEDLDWSPDGQWLAIIGTKWDRNSDDLQTDLYLIPISGGSSRLLVHSSYLYFWLSIPGFQFKVGHGYEITQPGANLNLRKAPSIKAQVVEKLQPGDQVIFLDGPVSADGYSWWQMRLEKSGKVGWAVERPDWYTPIGVTSTPTP